MPEQADMYPPIAEPLARASEPLPRRVLNWAMRAWRPAGSVMAVCLALLLGWHVVNGKHGLTTWNQKRVEDKQLQKEIDDLQQENARLHTRVDRLKSNPDEIEHEAREKLHYAKPGEVIYALPEASASQSQPATQNR
ncbi:FtsB family cell division protein [Terracidiphilus gabretensis]|uniref:FtsB family cell division protein n=1 Tax=Terracidiphilus gabretensis TaxID=1577687 RepID=UPI001E52AF29|nr:septum formation initiator family protein [Terracidiphilus gabretensis]